MPRKRTTRRSRSKAIARRPARRAPARRRSTRRKSPARRRYARRAGRAIGRTARRGVTLAAKVAADHKHTVFAVATGGLLGAVEDRIPGLDKVPGIKFLTPAGLVGLALFGLSFVVKKGTAGQLVRHGATGCLSIASYSLSKKYLAPSSKKFTISGDEYFDEYDVSGAF